MRIEWLRQRALRVGEIALDRVRRHKVLGEIYEFLDGTIGDYTRDHGPMYAGALAFYGILSLIPLIVLLASLSGFALAGGNEAAVDASLQELMVQLRKIIPYIDPSLEHDLQGIIHNRRSLGAVGFVALLFSASEIFRAVEFALARIFARLDHYGDPDDEQARPRNYLKSKLWFGAFVTALVLVFLALRLVFGVFHHLVALLPLPGWVLELVADPLSGGSPLGKALTAVFLVVGFVVVLKVFTHTKVHSRYGFIGAGLFYVLFQTARVLYDVYLARFTNVGAMYGSFAALAVVILWIYFSATLLLLCCHVTKVAQRRVMHGPRWPKDKLALW